MKALIIGCGRVGSSVALQLLSEGWDVTVVDENADALSRLGSNWAGAFVVGHGMDVDVLREAGIEEADVFIASTDGDNTNLTISQIAQKHYEVEKVIVRVMDPARAAWYSEQGLHTICPTQHAIEMFTSALGAIG